MRSGTPCEIKGQVGSAEAQGRPKVVSVLEVENKQALGRPDLIPGDLPAFEHEAHCRRCRLQALKAADACNAPFPLAIPVWGRWSRRSREELPGGKRLKI